MSDFYDPSGWYWRLDDGRVYSSRAVSYVPDAPKGQEIASVPDEAALLTVLEAQAPQSLPRSSRQWADYIREKIRLEADRRIQVAIAARNLDHSAEALRTAALTSAAIINKKTIGEPLLPEEKWAEGVYAMMFAYIRGVKAAQNVLEAALDETYADDRHWPKI